MAGDGRRVLCVNCKAISDSKGTCVPAGVDFSGRLPSAFHTAGSSSFSEFLTHVAPEMLPGRSPLPPGLTADVAPHARLVSVRGGMLTVAVVDPIWATQLRYLEPAIVTRATALLGPGVVASMRVRVSPS